LDSLIRVLSSPNITVRDGKSAGIVVGGPRHYSGVHAGYPGGGKFGDDWFSVVSTGGYFEI